MRTKRYEKRAEPEGELLSQVEIRLIETKERERWDQLMKEAHYLHNPRMVGEQLRYVAVLPDGTWLALLGWSSAAYHLKPRDRWIGWNDLQRSRGLKLIAQNSRFLILAQRQQYPNLASKALGLNLQRLSQDWERVYGHRIVVVETFIDPERFIGTCYKATGWQTLGPTGGFRRGYKDFYTDTEHPKELWVKALEKQALDWLKAEALPPVLGVGLEEGAVRCKYKSPQLRILWECFHRELTDPRARRGKRHKLATILSIGAAATLAGEKGYEGFADFAQHLSRPQRRHLRCYQNPKTLEYDVPSEPTFRRAFKRLDQEQFYRVLGRWLGEHDPEQLTAVAVDGKTVKGSRQANGKPVHLMSAVTHDTGRLLNQLAVDEKSNEIPAFCPLLSCLPLENAIVTSDAEHLQRRSTRFLIYGKGTEYLLFLKGNQPNALAKAQQLLPGDIPPSG